MVEDVSSQCKRRGFIVHSIVSLHFWVHTALCNEELRIGATVWGTAPERSENTPALGAGYLC